jgi:hypothetical protein
MGLFFLYTGEVASTGSYTLLTESRRNSTAALLVGSYWPCSPSGASSLVYTSRVK